MHGKTMREALQEARDYRDDTNEGGPGSGPQKGGKKQSSADIKKAYGILNDPRYKQGNYSGAAKAIDKLSPGLSNHPDVKNAMKRANEELEEERTYTVIHTKHGIEKSIKANGTYDAAQKYAKMKGLKDTSGVNARLEEESTDEMFSTRSLGLKGASKRSRDKVREKDKDSEKTKKKEDLDEAAFSQAQIDSLKKAYRSLSVSTSSMNKLRDKMKRYSKDHLSQLAKQDIPMVSDVAKELTEAVVGLPFSRTLMYIIKTDRNTAKKIKSFLADNGEKYPIHIDDNGSGQITLDAYNYTGGEKKAALAAAQAIAKKFNVKDNATR